MSLQLIDLLHELVEDIIPRQLPDGVAVDEQHCLALSAGNADVSLTGFAGAVDDTAHDSHLDGLFATLKPPLYLICDFSAGVLGATAQDQGRSEGCFCRDIQVFI